MKIISKYIFVITILASFVKTSLCNYVLSGYITDASTGESLPGVNIYNEDKGIATISNNFGYYSIELPNDSIILSFSFVGYKSQQITFLLNSDKQQNIELEPGILIQEVEISQNLGLISSSLSSISLPIKYTKNAPELMGESDILKVWQLLPGVQPGNEGKTSLFVRGGNEDQNLILLDDVPLFRVTHLGGFYSVFNSDAITSSTLYTGGFPAKYGGRISSVMDIRMKNGNKKKMEFRGSIGMLSSKFSLEGPVQKEKSSYILSARASYFPIFNKVFDLNLNYGFHDINFKYNQFISSKDHLFYSFYFGKDKLKIMSGNESNETSITNITNWGNILNSIRWNHIYNPNLFGNLTLYHTKYNYQLLNGYKSINYFSESLRQSFISETSIKYDFECKPSNYDKIDFGMKSSYYRFLTSSNKTKKIIDDSLKVESNTNENPENKFLNSLYFDYSYLAPIDLKINGGIRLSLYSSSLFFEPRLTIEKSINSNLTFKTSVTKMIQFIHLVQYTGTGAPSDYWIQSSKNIPPEKSWQYVIGVNKKFHKNWSVNLETYYKNMDGLTMFKEGASIKTNTNSFEEIIEKNGKGESFGTEFLLAKESPKSDAWLSMSICKSTRKFQNLNNNRPFPSNTDRLFNIKTYYSYRFNENLTFCITWIFNTGSPFTLPVAKYEDINSDGYIFVYDGINNARMEAYHRMDIGFNFSKDEKWGESNWNISIFNLYNRKNPYYYYLEYDDDGALDSNGLPLLKLYKQSLFSFFPSLSYSFVFN